MFFRHHRTEFEESGNQFTKTASNRSGSNRHRTPRRSNQRRLEMNRQEALRRWAFAMAAILFVALIPVRMHAANGYIQHNLVSDVPLLADFTDSNLVNPWGITFPALWVCNNRTGTFNVYGA